MILIGEDCRISHQVSLYSNTHRARNYLTGLVMDRLGDIIIGDGCWVGCGVYIGPGVTLPPRSIVPANSVVTRSLKSPDELIPKHG